MFTTLYLLLDDQILHNYLLTLVFLLYLHDHRYTSLGLFNTYTVSSSFSTILLLNQDVSSLDNCISFLYLKFLRDVLSSTFMLFARETNVILTFLEYIYLTNFILVFYSVLVSSLMLFLSFFLPKQSLLYIFNSFDTS